MGWWLRVERRRGRTDGRIKMERHGGIKFLITLQCQWKKKCEKCAREHPSGFFLVFSPPFPPFSFLFFSFLFLSFSCVSRGASIAAFTLPSRTSRERRKRSTRINDAPTIIYQTFENVRHQQSVSDRLFKFLIPPPFFLYTCIVDAKSRLYCVTLHCITILISANVSGNVFVR